MAAALSGYLPALRPGRFGWGAAQLSGASLASRLIGFAYSAAVMRLAGPEAVGLFRVVWPLYATAFTLATAGIPYAMTKLIAERLDPTRRPEAGGPPGTAPEDGARRRALAVARTGLVLLGLNSLAIAALVWAGSPLLLGGLAGETRGVALLRLLSPGLAVATLASGCRAIFEGIRRMAVPAASLVLEQTVLSATAIYLATVALRRQMAAEEVAAALAFASVLGEAAGLVLLALSVNRLWRVWRAAATSPHGHPSGTEPATFREILALALPIAWGRLAASVGASLNSLVLPNRLQSGGLSSSEAAVQIGLLRGVAIPLVLAPNILSLALMTNLVPSISGALARGRRDLARTYSDKALATTALYSLPVYALLAAFPEPLTRLLFGEVEATPLLAAAAAAAPFVYLGQTLVGVLRGLGRPHVPVEAHLVGLAVDTALVWVLAANPAAGIRGAAIASALGYVSAYLINQVDALRHLGTGLRLRQFALPAAGCLAAALAARGVGMGAAWLARQHGLGLLGADAAALGAGGLVVALVYWSFLSRSSLWQWLSRH